MEKGNLKYTDLNLNRSDKLEIEIQYNPDIQLDEKIKTEIESVVGWKKSLEDLIPYGNRALVLLLSNPLEQNIMGIKMKGICFIKNGKIFPPEPKPISLSYLPKTYIAFNKNGKKYNRRAVHLKGGMLLDTAQNEFKIMKKVKR